MGHFVRIEVWSNHFLGTIPVGSRIVALMEQMDSGRWKPDRWGHLEPVRKLYGPDQQEELFREWTTDRPIGSGRMFNYLYLRKRRPRAAVSAHAIRLKNACLNTLSIEFDAKSFGGPEGSSRLRQLLLDWVIATNAVLGSVFYSRQAHKRIARLTPLERIDQVHWLNYYGKPYVQLIGEDRIRSCPGCHVEDAPSGGLLLQVKGPFDAPDVTGPDQLFLEAERHLGTQFFAGYGFPEKPCLVPDFDLSDVTLLT